jgi:hypothetical protein
MRFGGRESSRESVTVSDVFPGEPRLSPPPRRGKGRVVVVTVSRLRLGLRTDPYILLPYTGDSPAPRASPAEPMKLSDGEFNLLRTDEEKSL